MRVPIYFEGDLTMDEIAAIFVAAGYCLRTEGGRVIAARVPRFLKSEPANVTRLPARLRKATS